MVCGRERILRLTESQQRRRGVQERRRNVRSLLLQIGEVLQRLGMPPCPVQRQPEVEPRLWVARIDRSGPIEKISRLGKLSHFQPVRTLLAKRCERAAIFTARNGRLGWLQNAVRHARTG